MKNNSREKSLIKNTLIITIGTICTKLITFLLLPLYTHVLTTSEYGLVDLFNTIISLLLPIVSLQIEQAVFRDLLEVRENKIEQKKIISTSIFFVTIQCIIYSIIVMIVSPLINNDYKFFLLSNVIVNIYSSLFLQIARGIGENKKFAIGSFISALFTILFNVLFLVCINLRVTGMLLGIFIGQLFGVIYLFVLLKIYKNISINEFNKKLLKKLLIYSLPLIPNAISWWIFGSSDRVIVSSVLGLSSNGVLSAASKFSGMFITVYNIFNISWTESISLHIRDKDISDYFSKMFNNIFNLFICFSIVLISMMPFLYNIMVDSEYSEGFTIVPILIVGALFNVLVGLISVVYVAEKNTKAIANTSIVSAILNIVIHLGLIKFLGLYAAAISTLASYFIMGIYRLNDINKKYMKIEINKTKILTAFLVLIIVCIVYYINNMYLNIVFFIISIIYSIFSNKSSFILIKKLIISKIKRVN